MRLKEDYDRRRKRRRWIVLALIVSSQISITFAYKLIYPDWPWVTAILGALITSVFLGVIGTAFYRMALAGQRPKGNIYDRRAGKRNYYDF